MHIYGYIFAIVLLHAACGKDAKKCFSNCVDALCKSGGSKGKVGLSDNAMTEFRDCAFDCFEEEKPTDPLDRCYKGCLSSTCSGKTRDEKALKQCLGVCGDRESPPIKLTKIDPGARLVGAQFTKSMISALFK